MTTGVPHKAYGLSSMPSPASVDLEVSKAHAVYYLPALLRANEVVQLTVSDQPASSSSARTGDKGSTKSAPRRIIVWHDKVPIMPSVFTQLPPRARLNRFVGMGHAARKATLTRMLGVLRSLHPDRGSKSHPAAWYPESWCLPPEWDSFCAAAQSDAPSAVYILKPSKGCRGEAIRLVASASSVPRELRGPRSADPLYVIQRYHV